MDASAPRAHTHVRPSLFLPAPSTAPLSFSAALGSGGSHPARSARRAHDHRFVIKREKRGAARLSRAKSRGGGCTIGELSVHSAGLAFSYASAKGGRSFLFPRPSNWRDEVYDCDSIVSIFKLVSLVLSFLFLFVGLFRTLLW